MWTKPILVAMSHAIERFALAVEPEDPLVVVALFQRLSYFEREVEVYRRIAARAALTVVGVTEDFPPGLAPGVSHVRLDPDESLAGEWSVTALGPRTGATLVARDLETVTPAAATLESGRQFSGGWSFRRELAYTELLRLRDQLGDRLDPAQLGVLDQVLTRVLATPGVAAEAQLADALGFTADLVEAGEQRGDHYLRELDRIQGRGRDPQTGLRTPGFLAHYSTGSGPGTLPVGMLLIRLHALAGLRPAHGARAELAVLQSLARTLAAPLAACDMVVRTRPDEFLILLPGHRGDTVIRIHRQLTAAIAALGRSYPFVPLPALFAATVTRTRPLPVNELAAALDETTDPDPDTGAATAGEADGVPHSGSLVFLAGP
ncbi:DICT sensory domain-containing protein [Pseudonocardia tropica]|uniref:DICT sensory domain-containing protein n=1 Tax=Pseudonocardia tropica TaxID=681289 RepID=UPI0031ECC0C6